jgi:class 3 adenylate cyclase
MTLSWVALGVAVAAGVILSLALGYARRRVGKLERAMSRAAEDLERLERAFGRFAPEDVVEKLGQGAKEIAPERREVTIMFADLVGFTPMSERVDPGALIPVLNDYFRRMSRVIREHHGHVSRIMGDGLMALFGALVPNSWQSADAVRAALAMRAALEELNVEIEKRGLPRLRFGVGLNRGDVVAAVVGSDQLMEFTVMGDAVNLAARVEGLTRAHGVDILVTDPVRDRLDDRFELRELPPTEVKGKTEPVRTWAVIAFRE